MEEGQWAIAKQEFVGLEISGVEETDIELGRGAYGVVRKATWWGTPCVTKRLHAILSSEAQSKHSSDFIRECYTWSRLRHPHIVQFLGLIFEEGAPLPVIVIELLSTSLRNHLEQHSHGSFLLRDKITVLHHVILGLAYLHGQKHIHRDLTTNNVLLDTHGWHAKISDFGVTRVLADERVKQTASTIVPGAEAFMGPEAFDTSSKFQFEFDVFSYGCVITSTISHAWPQPSPAKKKKDGKLIALTELERRQQYIDLFTPEEKDTFLGIIEHCLEDEVEDRPTSLSLVENMDRLRCAVTIGDTAEEIYQDTRTVNASLQEELDCVKKELEHVKKELEEVVEEKELLQDSKAMLVEAQEELFTKLSKENELLEETVKQLKTNLNERKNQPAEDNVEDDLSQTDTDRHRVMLREAREDQEDPFNDTISQKDILDNRMIVTHYNDGTVVDGEEFEFIPDDKKKEPFSPVSHSLPSTSGFPKRTTWPSQDSKTPLTTQDGTPSEGPILFHRKGERYYEFNPWYPAPVVIEGKRWPSCENYYLARKYEGTPLETSIRDCPTSKDAYRLTQSADAQKYESQGWEYLRVEVMNVCLEKKFEQHFQLQQLLLSTGNRELVYHTRSDSFRGDGGDGSGENRLGKKLMQIRSELLPLSFLSDTALW